MKINENENVLIGKLIGFLNGLDEFLPTPSLIDEIKRIVWDLKNKINIEKDIEIIDDLKKKYLSSCFTCASPCGRTNDYSINDIINAELREDRIREYNEFISNYSLDTEFKDIVFHLSKLSW